MIINIDPQFTPFGKENTIAFKAFTFSGGEPHIKILTNIPTNDTVWLTHRIQSFNDFGIILLAIDALKRMNVRHIHLFIPYFPGARQDRIMSQGEALTVKIYTDILNALNLEEVLIYDAHSEVTPALLNQSTSINNFQFIDQVVQTIHSDNMVLVSPDGGALKKIYKLASYLKHHTVVECSKVRNIETGKLSHFTVYTEDLKGKDCLIVDDICDGGGTFLGLAKALKAKNAGKLYLAVSHGIFSKGFNALEEHYEHIYTTDSFKTIEPRNRVIQIPLKLEL